MDIRKTLERHHYRPKTLELLQWRRARAEPRPFAGSRVRRYSLFSRLTLRDDGILYTNNNEATQSLPYLPPSMTFASAVQTELKPSAIGSIMLRGLKLISNQRSQLFPATLSCNDEQTTGP